MALSPRMASILLNPLSQSTPGARTHVHVPTPRCAIRIVATAILLIARLQGSAMSISTLFRAALFCTAVALPALASAADQWHFKVTNATESRITKLQVSQDKSNWGDFDIGSGIGAGDTETLVWDSSTDSEGCDQWIRAKFKDGSTSPASKQNFCEDLDTPIVFGEE
jgi:hypothetical protein